MNFELRSNYLTMTKNKDKKQVEQPIENQVKKETVEIVNNTEAVNDGEATAAEEVSETDPLQAKVAELEARVMGASWATIRSSRLRMPLAYFGSVKLSALTGRSSNAVTA